MNKIFVLAILLLYVSGVDAQVEKRSFQAEKISDKIIIDGLLNEAV